MLLVYSLKTTQRISYIFKHICTRILGVDVKFTSQIEEFIAYAGPKMSYGKKPLGNEFFIKSYGLLTQQGFESVDVLVKDWEETKCFFSVGKVSKLPFDIFSASFYLLSRYEEYLPHVKDDKGRFLASESIAFKEGFLQEPVVDIWAYKFKNLLESSFPKLIFPKKKAETHNLIDASLPFAFKQKGFLRSISGIIKDISTLKFKSVITRIGVILGFKEDPFLTFDWIIENVKESKAKITIFFLIGEALHFYEGTNFRRKKFQLLIKKVSDYMQVGLIFSKEALLNFKVLNNEKKQLEVINNIDLESSCNTHYLLSLPNDYRKLVELEVKKDFSMVYEYQAGFRASSCTPFLFYDLDYEIVTPLLIHPIALTSSAFNETKEQESLATIENIIKSVNNVKGTFSMYFTNRNFYSDKKNEFWKNLLIRLSKDIEIN